jgi:lysophospholipase L1-like esterase
LRDYAVLLDTTRKISPSTQIYVQSLLPVNSTYFHDKITAITPIIKEVNQALYDLCKERNCQYIDLYKSFAQSDLLPENYSPDGLHLKDEGYEIWFNKVKNAIN